MKAAFSDAPSRHAARARDASRAMRGILNAIVVTRATMRTTHCVLIIGVMLAGCKDDPKAASEAGASASASATASVASVIPSASASAPPEVQHDCPPGSTGLGSAAKPCDAKGTARMIEIAWNGKRDSQSGAPTFKVTSKAPKAIVWAKVAVYFYDKTGQLIDVKEPIEGSDKTHTYHVCLGNLFAPNLGIAEKATYNFSCVGKSNVPDGATAIEVEAQRVAFADASGKKADFYWRNNDLTPETRPKGGVK
jgi:hypothetical protein